MKRVHKHTTPVASVARDDKLLLFLSSEIGQGTAGVVHGRTIKIESEHRHLTVDTAAKLAFTNSQQARLELE
jgi:hypothetical protein